MFKIVFFSFFYVIGYYGNDSSVTITVWKKKQCRNPVTRSTMDGKNPNKQNIFWITRYFSCNRTKNCSGDCYWLPVIPLILLSEGGGILIFENMEIAYRIHLKHWCWYLKTPSDHLCACVFFGHKKKVDAIVDHHRDILRVAYALLRVSIRRVT